MHVEHHTLVVKLVCSPQNLSSVHVSGGLQKHSVVMINLTVTRLVLYKVAVKVCGYAMAAVPGTGFMDPEQNILTWAKNIQFYYSMKRGCHGYNYFFCPKITEKKTNMLE